MYSLNDLNLSNVRKYSLYIKVLMGIRSYNLCIDLSFQTIQNIVPDFRENESYSPRYQGQ